MIDVVCILQQLNWKKYLFYALFDSLFWYAHKTHKEKDTFKVFFGNSAKSGANPDLLNNTTALFSGYRVSVKKNDNIIQQSMHV